MTARDAVAAALERVLGVRIDLRDDTPLGDLGVDAQAWAPIAAVVGQTSGVRIADADTASLHTVGDLVALIEDREAGR